MLDDILNAICDGRWHSIGSLARRFNIDIDKLEKALDFLDEYDFVELNYEKARVKTSKTYFILHCDLKSWLHG